MTIGRIVWFDLFTTDPQAAPSFYGPVVGWTAGAATEGSYRHWQAPDSMVGGFERLPEAAAAMGAPSHWVGYTHVANVDETVAKATALGAHVYFPPTDVGTTGRIAVLADPQGAQFAVYAHGPNAPQDPPNDQKGLGQLSWCELATSDVDGAKAFYGELFGWRETGTMDMGPDAGTYSMFGQHDGDMIGAMMARPKEMPMSAWVYYFRVADCDAAYHRAKELGAEDRYPPMDIPGGGRACLIADPQGATFGLVHEPKT